MQKQNRDKNGVLLCTKGNCKNAQTADGEYCEKHYPQGIKYFYALCDVGEGIPSYDFVVKAKTLEKAIKITSKILKADYPENWEYNKNDFSVCEITADELLKRLLLN